MASEPILAALDARVVQPRRAARVLSDYWALTKPEINFVIAITTAAGFWLGSPETVSQLPWAALVHTLFGTVLVASGAATLNQVIELRFDALMKRTARRPVASGRMLCSHALWFGMALSILGVAYLEVTTNSLASLLAAFTLMSYLFLYTPLKRRTPLCTLVGAVPGAMPPLIGWAAAHGHLEAGAWALFAIVFLWQFPHFMAIAWLYREDYARAGYLVLPLGESKCHFATWQTLAGCMALVPVGLIPTVAHVLGFAGSVAVIVLSLIFSYYGAHFAYRRSSVTARHLLAASIIYLPVVFALIMVHKK